MEELVIDKVNDVDLKRTMERSYIDYAMSVIAARALPDVRDGLKPVQRRILYAMSELNNGPDKPHRKCARIVGDTMGKFHPHGDSSIYEALVKLAQNFSTRYPLVDGHGNFGSVDGDSAAAMRYTEARLSKMSVEMLADINKKTVDFFPNFDETEQEPGVLPSRFPNLLVNGTSGIAVGMATNIPPHNLVEVINAVIKMIDNYIEENRETALEELLEIIEGPDFPTGAEIVGTAGIREAYRTGRGKICVRAITEIEPMQNGKNRIIVKELPYMVNKARLIEKIAELVKEKKVEGITELRDESDRTGMRIVIELRRDINANVMLNQLYKHTQLQDTFGIIMLALEKNEPRILNLYQMLDYYLQHQKEIVTRRTQHDLTKAEERAHILQGLLIALDNIDEVISIIRSSENSNSAKEKLILRFTLTDVQAQAIIDMRLRTLTGLEKEKLEKENSELMRTIAEFKDILADNNRLLEVIKEEITVIRDKYGDVRRTRISMDELDFSIEDLIPDENTIIAMTRLGYIKRMDIDNFKCQNRGGKGIKGIQMIDEDFIEELLMTRNHNFILFFTNRGRVYRLKAYQIPACGRTARGTAIVNLLEMQPEEHITAIITLKEFEQDHFLFMATKNGIVKKTPAKDYQNIRKSGIQAIILRENDELIEVKSTNNNNDIFLVTKRGMCIRFNEKDVRGTSRNSMGVIGMALNSDDEVVGMQLNTQGTHLLFVSERGLGKRTEMNEFSVQYRGGKGVKCYKLTEKTGHLVGVKAVDEQNEVILITSGGTTIRLLVRDISILGRITSGVKLIEIKTDISVASFIRVKSDEISEPSDLQLDTILEKDSTDDFNNCEEGSNDANNGQDTELENGNKGPENYN